MKALAFAFTLAAAAAALPSTAQAVIYRFEAVLDGPSEAPPNASPATGFATVLWDTTAHTAMIQANFSGLLGTTTAAHIHAPTALPGAGTAGVATQTPSFIGFPLGVTAGTFSNTYATDAASSYRPGFITLVGGLGNAETTLYNALHDGTAYFNIHTNVVPGGEIRGFFQAVPEPGTWALMIAGFGAAGAALRRRRTAVP